MHSRHARNLFDPKIKIIFEIAWALFEIILFIHLNKKHFMKKLRKRLMYIWINFDFHHAGVKKCLFMWIKVDKYDLISKRAHAISKIIFILGSNKFLACLEHFRSYAWSFGHSDPDPSSVICNHGLAKFENLCRYTSS